MYGVFGYYDEDDIDWAAVDEIAKEDNKGNNEEDNEEDLEIEIEESEDE